MTYIVLNEPSSSGKTTLAKALQDTVTQLSICVSLDHFVDTLPTRITCDHDLLVDTLEKHVIDFNQSLTVLSAGFRYCIIDYVFERCEWFLSLRDALKYRKSIWIGLYCDASELIQREQMRGNRKIGLAVSHMNSVHYDIKYNHRLDTVPLNWTNKLRKLPTCYSEPTDFFQTHQVH